MQRRTLLIMAVLVGIAALLMDASATLRAQAGSPAPAVPRPTGVVEVIPLLQKPFTGEFTVVNLFDHEFPFEFKDDNGFLRTFWGGRSAGVDGHEGYDWIMPEGTPILAAGDGDVVTAATTSVLPGFCPVVSNPTPLNSIEIRHTAPDGAHFSTRYLHLSRLDVQKGDVVSAGQQIGLAGNSGCSTKAHLHFGVLRWEGTNNGKHTLIDPYGWEGPGDDPWAQHPQGARSAWLWNDGQAPLLFHERTNPPNAPSGSAAVTITTLRSYGYHDDRNPNNEFVEFTLDPRFAPGGSVDLTGFSLTNNAGDARFTFPRGFVIHQDAPVRVYSGAGQNTNSELYWGRDQGVWDDMGDCAHLLRPDGRVMYRLTDAKTCS